MDSSNLVWAIVQSPPIPLILNRGLIPLIIALSPSFILIHSYNTRHTSIPSLSTHSNTLHHCVQVDSISSFYTPILFTFTLILPSITPISHTLFSKHTQPILSHNTILFYSFTLWMRWTINTSDMWLDFPLQNHTTLCWEWEELEAIEQ